MVEFSSPLLFPCDLLNVCALLFANLGQTFRQISNFLVGDLSHRLLDQVGSSRHTSAFAVAFAAQIRRHVLRRQVRSQKRTLRSVRSRTTLAAALFHLFQRSFRQKQTNDSKDPIEPAGKNLSEQFRNNHLHNTSVCSPSHCCQHNHQQHTTHRHKNFLRRLSNTNKNNKKKNLFFFFHHQLRIDCSRF